MLLVPFRIGLRLANVQTRQLHSSLVELTSGHRPDPRARTSANRCAPPRASVVRSACGRAQHPPQSGDESDERELLVTRQPRNADPDEPKRTGAVCEGAVEQRAGELADLGRLVDADAERRRTRADGEVGVAQLRRDRARRPARLLQMLARPRAAMRRSSACSCARSVRSRSNVFSTLIEMRTV